MPFELYAYRRVGDLERLLRALPPARGRTFLVAGSGDRELLAVALSGSDSSPEYRIRRWDEIYRYFCEERKANSIKTRIVTLKKIFMLWFWSNCKANSIKTRIVTLYKFFYDFLVLFYCKANSIKTRIVTLRNLSTPIGIFDCKANSIKTRIVTSPTTRGVSQHPNCKANSIKTRIVTNISQKAFASLFVLQS